MKTNLLIFACLLLFASCNKKERLFNKFVDYAQSLDIEKIKSISTEDTRFWLSMTYEPLISLASPEKSRQLKQMAQSLTCKGQGDSRSCSFQNENGETQEFELNLVKEINTEGKPQLLIDIPKNYFLGD